MNPLDTYKESIAELRECVGGIEFLHGVPVELPKRDMEYLERILKAHTLCLLENEIESLKNEKSPYRPKDREFYKDVDRECGWEAFRKRRINRLQEAVDSIKEL